MGESQDDLFAPGQRGELVPEGEAARQAVDSLRGYAYQIIATALAWLDVGEDDQIYMEVAEDYAVLARDVLEAVQVKDTAKSGTVTLNTESVRTAITSFVDLVDQNPRMSVQLRYLTTSQIGVEKKKSDRPAGTAGLRYWSKVAAGADVGPLRARLESNAYPERVRTFCHDRDDATLRRDLFNKISWDCGSPDIRTLQEELVERLIVVGRERYSLPAQEARELINLLAFQVLRKSIGESSGQRVLTRAKLNSLVDEATRTSLSRPQLDNLISALSKSFGAQAALPAPSAPAWLIEGSTLPHLNDQVPRPEIEDAVMSCLNEFSLAIVWGSSGLGKSRVARKMAEATSEGFFVVDFRDVDFSEGRRRLDQLFARLAGLPTASALLLEDLNFLDHPKTTYSMARLVEASRRHRIRLLITCYQAPSKKVLASANIGTDSLIECRYFSEKEVGALVSLNLGNSDRWARLAYVVGAFGHPQLTHAYILGLAARGWPEESISETVVSGLRSQDTEAERDAARQTLLDTLPPDARRALYRLSLLIRFRRAEALLLGPLPPPIAQIGEYLDQLIGPWVEAVGDQIYRVSPLVANSGQVSLPLEEQRAVHSAVAAQRVHGGKIDANDIDAVVMHAILGESWGTLLQLAMGLISSDQRTLELVAEASTIFVLFQSAGPIVPKNPHVSLMVRLAQFKMAVAGREKEKASEIATVLLKEMDLVPEAEGKSVTDGLTLMTILVTIGVGDYYPGWIQALVQYKALAESDPLFRGLREDLEGGPQGLEEARFYGFLFSVGFSGVSSVERLEEIVGQLDALNPVDRESFLVPADESQEDYSLFVHSTWAAQRSEESFDPRDADERYSRVARTTQAWGAITIARQCWVARAIMLDEFQDDPAGALGVLKEAERELGPDRILLRARAKIHWRNGDHHEALEIQRSIADGNGGKNTIERAFALREAAISAAKCGEWSLAEKWFLEAKAGADAAHSGSMEAMAVGLDADAAVEAIRHGNVETALRRFASSLAAAQRIDPEASLQAAYLHRALRHAILWAQAQIGGEDVEIDGVPIALQPGTCSNPDPPEAIRAHPLADIDYAWYMLASIEVAANVEAGIKSNLPTILSASGPIPIAEILHRTKCIEVALETLNASKVAEYLVPYAEAVLYRIRHGSTIRVENDMLVPQRANIPKIEEPEAHDDPTVRAIVIDVVLAFCIVAICRDSLSAIPQLRNATEEQLGSFGSAFSLMENWEQAPGIESLDREVAGIIRSLLEGAGDVAPNGFWMMGARFYERLKGSNWRYFLSKKVAAWQRQGWASIIAARRFDLVNPTVTTVSISAVLARPTNDESFLGELLLAAADAVGIQLGPEYRELLSELNESITQSAV